jgi:hypothetical protein
MQEHKDTCTLRLARQLTKGEAAAAGLVISFIIVLGTKDRRLVFALAQTVCSHQPNGAGSLCGCQNVGCEKKTASKNRFFFRLIR